MLKGIDVAKWNGTINWTRVKYAGVDFAILKVIDKTGNTEGAFERNYAGATAHGIAVGVYNYSYATTVQKAREDAQDSKIAELEEKLKAFTSDVVAAGQCGEDVYYTNLYIKSSTY